VFARRQARVEQRPEFRALGLGLPLAKAVAVAEDALLGPGLFLVAANSSMASSSVTDWCTLRLSPGCAKRTVPRAMESSTLRTISSAPSSLARWSRKSVTSGKLWPVSIISSG
jgi:hypothetical protein